MHFGSSKARILKDDLLFYTGQFQKKWTVSHVCNEVTSEPTWYIQGVSRLVDITAGGDFLGLCDQKSSYKHVSDFGRLRSYGHF